MLDSEILAGFKEETNQLMNELTGVVDRLEARTAEFPAKLLEEFALKIDRIMGAAKTMSVMDPTHQGLVRIGSLAEICKRLGYKAAASGNTSIIPIFAAFWADVIEVVQELIEAVEDEAASASIARSFGAVLQRRLEWLAGQLAALAPNAKSTPGAAEADLGLQDLLKKLTS